MDKKSWPWKKKISDKMPSSPELSDVPQPSATKHPEELEALGVSSDEASSDSCLKVTTEHLVSSTMADTSVTDELVKQHMKIAEEAVAGWEKAEAEAADLKEKLEVAIQQKMATEDRVSHLDGALKECMKQLRHVREEQEQKIHDAMVKKTREWEKVRTDLEARLDDATNDLCEALAENQAMSKSLQERSKTIAELLDAKIRLEAGSGSLQIRLASVEKENARFKYELHVLNKELEVRNEERDYVKRAEEASSKQNMERSKKIAKLEEECQRLRLLIKKRQPSPAPLSHMKGEPDILTNERIRRQSPCRRSTTSFPFKAGEFARGEIGFDDGLREENKLLSDQLLAMQDEAKSLKELLAKKDNELQSQRLKPASKLSNVEEQLEVYPYPCSIKSAHVPMPSQQSINASIDPSISSVSGESGVEDVCAESWASALMAELAQFKNESKVSISLQDSLSIDFMDDFAEMEKLASLSSPDEGSKLRKMEKESVSSTDKSLMTCVEELKFFEGDKQGNGQEVESINDTCKEVKDKLAHAGDQLYALQEPEITSDASVNQLQQLVGLKFGAEADDTILNKAVEAVIVIEGESRKSANLVFPDRVNEAENEEGKESVWPSTYISHVGSAPQASSDKDFYIVGAELTSAVRKVLDIVEGLGQTDYSFPYAQWLSSPTHQANGKTELASPGKQWRSSGLDACVESLTNLCNSLVQGKVDIIDFIAEVASALDWLVGLIFALPEKPSARDCSQTHTQDEQVDSSDSEMISAESSPSQLLCNPSDVEEAKAMESQDVLPDHSSISNLSFQFSESSMLEEDTPKTVSEVVALKLSLETETRKANKYESEILRLKVVNDQLERNHELMMEKLAVLESQVHEANQKVQNLTDERLVSENQTANLCSQLRNALDQKQTIENEVVELEYAKGTLESELCLAKENVEALESKVLGLEEELNREARCRKEFEMQLIELKQEQREKSPEESAEDEATRQKKEQEIAAAAEKLAECQQTILDLGKQLKALGVTKDLLDTSFTCPSESSASSHKTPSVTTLRLRSASDQVHSSSMSDTSMETVDTMATSALRRARQEQNGVIRPLKSLSSSQDLEEPGTPAARKGGQANGKQGRQAQTLDVYNNHTSYNRFPSPTHGENRDGGQGFSASSNSMAIDPVANSPLRSPARFLSLRSRNMNGHEASKHGENEAGERHGSSGFSRFFARTKSGH